MKRNEKGEVLFTYGKVKYRLTDDGLDERWKGVKTWFLVEDIEGLLGNEDFRALLAEAIEALDHPYRGINTYVPPQHRAPGSKGSTQ